MRAAGCAGINGERCNNAAEKKNRVVHGSGGRKAIQRFLCRQCMEKLRAMEKTKHGVQIPLLQEIEEYQAEVLRQRQECEE